MVDALDLGAPEILLSCLLAVSAGSGNFTEIARFGEKKLALLRRFRPFKDGTPAPGATFPAVRQEGFYTFSVGEDFGLCEIRRSADHEAARRRSRRRGARRIPTSGRPLARGCDRRDRHVFVASIRHKPPIGKIPACGSIWAKAKREQAAEALEQGDKDYRACFNAHAPKERFFAGLTKEAQSFVDRLAGD